MDSLESIYVSMFMKGATVATYLSKYPPLDAVSQYASDMFTEYIVNP